jgi:hypothetical protein
VAEALSRTVSDAYRRVTSGIRHGHRCPQLYDTYFGQTGKRRSQKAARETGLNKTTLANAVYGAAFRDANETRTFSKLLRFANQRVAD